MNDWYMYSGVLICDTSSQAKPPIPFIFNFADLVQESLPCNN